MALSQLVLNELLNDAYRGDTYDPFSHLYDQHFGVGLLNNDLLLRKPTILGLSLPLSSGYLRSLRASQPEESGVSSISNQKDQLKVNLDVQQFKPEEISVKVVNDYLVVEGKHEEKQDKHGFIARQFTRRYKLPQDTNMDAITSNISSDGILSITAPKKLLERAGERQITITQTNQPAIKQTKASEGGSGQQEKMES